jgi:CheY-like chemotaxis protein
VLVIDKLLSGRRILVVEDEMLVLMSIEDMLADLGCESVAAAATVDQAVALIDAQVFDAAMLDMNLNGTKSFPVADKLAELGVPFIFATGYSAQDMRDGYGDRPLLKKPIRYAELAGVFASLLARPSGALEA